jgi:RNA polymerase sigma factor for flagellar operon FliA
MAKAESQKNTQELWAEYHRDPSEKNRNPLVELYMSLVKYNAERIHGRLPAEVELDDLISAGSFGLLDAIRAFDPNRGVKFETFCIPRIRGAILDELRSMDWIPRVVRSRGQKIQQASTTLEAQLGRKPTHEEVAERMGMPVDEYLRILRKAGTVSTISLSRTRYETDSFRDVQEIDIIEDRASLDPAMEVQKKDLRSLITKSLSRAERLVLILYYYEQMTMKEIGATLDLSESRVSQMHSAVLERLQSQIGNSPRRHAV